MASPSSQPLNQILRYVLLANSFRVSMWLCKQYSGSLSIGILLMTAPPPPRVLEAEAWGGSLFCDVAACCTTRHPWGPLLMLSLQLTSLCKLPLDLFIPWSVPPGTPRHYSHLCICIFSPNSLFKTTLICCPPQDLFLLLILFLSSFFWKVHLGNQAERMTCPFPLFLTSNPKYLFKAVIWNPSCKTESPGKIFKHIHAWAPLPEILI